MKFDLVPIWAKVLGIALLVALIYGAGFYQAHTNSLEKIGGLEEKVKTFKAADDAKTEALKTLNTSNSSLQKALEEQTKAVDALKAAGDDAKKASEAAMAVVLRESRSKQQQINSLQAIKAVRPSVEELKNPAILDELADCRRALAINAEEQK